MREEVKRRQGENFYVCILFYVHCSLAHELSSFCTREKIIPFLNY